VFTRLYKNWSLLGGGKGAVFIQPISKQYKETSHSSDLLEKNDLPK